MVKSKESVDFNLQSLTIAINELKNIANGAIAAEKTVADDKTTLKDAIDTLDFNVTLLEGWLPTDSERGGFFRVISAMLIAAFDIGTSAAYTISTINYMLTGQANLARAAQTEQTAERKAKLSEAVRGAACDVNAKFAVSDNFAGMIRPGVRSRLGLPKEGKGYPSVSTIKNTLRELKK